MRLGRWAGRLAWSSLLVAACTAAALERGELERALDDSPQPRAFYEPRAFAPAWVNDEGRASRLADQLVLSLRRSADDGLVPHAYAPETLARMVEASRTDERIPPEQAAQLEVALTATFLRLARELHDGRVDPKSVGWGIPQDAFSPEAALLVALEKGEVEAGLALARPTAPEYAKLKAALLELRSVEAQGGWPKVSPGRPLQEGEVDDRVLELRDRLRATAELMPAVPTVTLEQERTFDADVKHAVETFQRRHGLTADGKVAKRTLEALNVSVSTRITQVQRTMERWRWMPADRGERYVMVNIASFELDAYEAHGGKKVLHSAVVTGLEDPKWHTPVLSDVISGLDLNPVWNVPPKIIREDLVPLLQTSPGTPKAIGMKIYDRATGEEVDAASVTWTPEAAANYRMTQVAGPQNPLGETRVVMSNKKHIYLHGTPAGWVFELANRARSHGCIRVEKIAELSAWMLADAQKAKRYEEGVAKKKSMRLEFDHEVPVYLGYFTAFVDDGGSLQFRPDVYGLDRRLEKALKVSPPPKVEVSQSTRASSPAGGSR